MELNYINIINNNFKFVINELEKKDFSIKTFSASFNEKGESNLLVWLKLEDWDDISKIISKIEKIDDVINVVDMSENKKQVKYLFNVNCNCKKTLKRISREPDSIIETDKELIFVFILRRKEVEAFISELSNLRLPYLQRVIWLT